MNSVWPLTINLFIIQLSVCCRRNSLEPGLRYGDLAMKLYNKFKNEAWLCRVWTSYYGTVVVTKKPFAATKEPLIHAYRSGLR